MGFEKDSNRKSKIRLADWNVQFCPKLFICVIVFHASRASYLG